MDEETEEKSRKFHKLLHNIKENRENRMNYSKKVNENDGESDMTFLPLFMKSNTDKSEDDPNLNRDWESIDPNTALGLLQ